MSQAFRLRFLPISLATETFGVKALAEKLAADYSIEHFFIDHPSGL